MKFLYPNFLWALLFVLIPIIIHLFYFRRYKKIYFSNTNFLTEIKNEQATKNKLKHLLVLFTRILAIVFLVLAFAQPFIPNNKTLSSSKKLISIYLDNSFSMGAEGNGFLLFDEAKSIANKIIEAYNDNNVFQIISNDFEAKHQRLVSKSEALDLLKEITLSPAYQSKIMVLEKQKNNAKKFDGDKIFYQLSDFQKNNELVESDTLQNIQLINFSPSIIRNLSIEDASFLNPVHLVDQNNKLLITIKNQSEEDKSGSFQLSLNGEQKSLGNFSIAANSKTTDTISFTVNNEGWNKGKVSLNDYPLTFDDNFYFTFFAEQTIDVYSIYGEKNNFIDAVFKNNEQVNYLKNNINALDYKEIDGKHLVILNDLTSIPTGLASILKSYLESGGQLFIIPNKNIDLQNYNQFLASLSLSGLGALRNEKRTVSIMHEQHPLFEDIFLEKPNDIELPKVYSYYPSTKQVKQQSILSFSNNTAYLSSSSVGNGTVYLLTSSLDKQATNYTNLAIFAPMVYKMAVSGVKSTSIAFPIETQTNIAVNKIPKNNESILRLSNNDIELIPQKSIFNSMLQLQVAGNQLNDGFYSLRANEEDYNIELALNYNRGESALDYYSSEELKENYLTQSNIQVNDNNIAEISENIKLLENGKAYWKLCVILALLFLAIEILLLRFLPN